jgi:glycosyltransferase involved in cell wall biosynthesis
MRVCIIGSSKQFFSGITSHTIFLGNALGKRNQVSVVLLRNLLPRFLFPGRGRVGKGQYSIDFAPEIEVYDGMNYNSPLSWLRAYRFLKKQRPQVIIMQWWSSTAAHMQLFLKLMNSFKIGAKMILDMHEVVDPLEESILPIRLYSRVIGRRLVRGLDAYITHSEFAKGQVARTYKIDDDTISVIQMGLYEDYRQPIDKALAKEELGISEEFVILYFGLIRHYKGVPYLVKAFDLLPQAIASRSRLLIVGESWEEGQLIQGLIDSSSYKNQISLVPQYVPDSMIPRYFSAADVVVLPYLRAAGSSVVLIAMAYGKPVIVSDIEALRESLADYQGALFFPPGDHLALRDRLLQVREALNSQEKVYYPPPQRSWDDIAQSYEAILNRLVSEKGTAK